MSRQLAIRCGLTDSTYREFDDICNRLGGCAEHQEPAWSTTVRDVLPGEIGDRARVADLERVIVDSTVQSTAIAHPVDSRLLEVARHKVVSAAKRAGIGLKQTYAQEGKTLRRRAGGYTHAKQF